MHLPDVFTFKNIPKIRLMDLHYRLDYTRAPFTVNFWKKHQNFYEFMFF